MRPPRIGEFIQQFGGAYFSTEGALWRTLLLLLFKPGELTRQYLAGRRRRYVLPLRLYLTISVLALLLVRVTGGSDGVVEGPVATPAELRAEGEIKLGIGSAGFKAGVFYCKDLPSWLCKRLKKRVDVDAKETMAQVDRFRERFLGNLGAVMFIQLPIFALLLNLAYWNRRMRYTEHLVFALHVHAFWFLVVAVLTSGVAAIGIFAVATVPIYSALAARRVYGGRWGPTLLRGATVMSVYGLTLAVTLVLVGLWSFLT